MKKAKQTGRSRRHFHIRNRVKGTSDRPRVSVFRSNRHIYAQAINDEDGKVITGLSTLSGAFKEAKVEGNKKDQAKELGKILAQELKKRGINKIVFDRAGYKYHGRIKALAEAAREAGLEF
jgi:large subunit ribosomal protein L18